MKLTYAQIIAQHQILQKTEAAPVAPERVEQVKAFIADVVAAGTDIADPRQREQLRSTLRYWSAWVYDRTKEFPPSQLAPYSVVNPSRPRLSLDQLRRRPVGFVLIVLASLVILSGAIEAVRLLRAWLAVENAARFAVRYAVAGTFDRQYCDEATTYYLSHPVPGLTDMLRGADDTAIPAGGALPDPANDCNIPEGVAHYEEKTNALQDWARLISIRDAARSGADGLSIVYSASGDYLQYLSNPGPLFDQAYRGDPSAPGYFNVTTCSDRPGVVVDPSLYYFNGIAQENYRYPAPCKANDLFTDDAGDPGNRVHVMITFRHPLIVPSLSVKLVAEREGIVEKFRTSQNIVLPGVPTKSPTPGPILVATATPPSPLTKTPTLPVSTPTPGATPQGGEARQIAFVSERIKGVPQIFLVNADGSNVTGLTFLPEGACQPAWSPDGQRLLFISPCRGKNDQYPRAVIYSMNPDGSDVQPFIAVTGGVFDADWSIAGIAFTHLENNEPGIYVAKSDGSDAVRISQARSDDSQPSWSPDGERLVFVNTSRTGQPVLYWMYKDGGFDGELPDPVTRPESSSFVAANFPDWSPAGDLVAYVIDLQIWVVRWDAKGFGPVQFTTAGPNADPDWSPDGQWIAFESWRNAANHDVYIMTASGSQQTRLTDDPAADYQPAWRP